MKTIGNIIGTILTVIGAWRLFAAIEASSLGFYMFSEAMEYIHSLRIQGILFLTIGIVILIIVNLPKGKTHRPLPNGIVRK